MSVLRILGEPAKTVFSSKIVSDLFMNQIYHKVGSAITKLYDFLGTILKWSKDYVLVSNWRHVCYFWWDKLILKGSEAPWS